MLLGKDNREILVLIAYNIPQETPTGDDTLHTPLIFLYLLDDKDNSNPRKLFIRDLFLVIKETTKENQDIILLEDFTKQLVFIQK